MQNPPRWAHNYVPEACRMNTGEVFLVVSSTVCGRGCGGSCVRRLRGGTVGDNVMLILVVDKVLFVCAHFGLELLSEVVGGGGREKS